MSQQCANCRGTKGGEYIFTIKGWLCKTCHWVLTKMGELH